ncbi:MAG: SDR family oxidoreductase [Bacteroidetes bacterium]|nr:SDR family oxidoreductase [Bacteroidota bacterium]
MNILITGGASGLGRSIVEKFVQQHCGTVYFTYNRSASTADEIVRTYNNVTAIKCDFTNSAEIADLCRTIPEFDVDILVNNAYGLTPFANFNKIGSDDFLQSFSNNVLPTIEITKACIATFRKKRSGKIITILTSYLLNVPPTGSAIYVADKAYLQELAKIWATENIRYNITSNSISPSFMQTPMTADTDERIVEQMTAGHPLKRLVTTDEVADMVLTLASASPHLNGVNVPMNAGENIV